MELTIYELIQILLKIENKNIKVKFGYYGKHNSDIEDIKVIGYLNKDPIVK